MQGANASKHLHKFPLTAGLRKTRQKRTRLSMRGNWKVKAFGEFLSYLDFYAKAHTAEVQAKHGMIPSLALLHRGSSTVPLQAVHLLNRRCKYFAAGSPGTTMTALWGCNP